jgi:hypothetical protein
VVYVEVYLTYVALSLMVVKDVIYSFCSAGFSQKSLKYNAGYRERK